ncbi:hypothetical protein Bbelb_108650 [Branchiostoma belcheri]|nr:hypothetical protein Bbelb_108650 [Branchiostoma belcheri]
MGTRVHRSRGDESTQKPWGREYTEARGPVFGESHTSSTLKNPPHLSQKSGGMPRRTPEPGIGYDASSRLAEPVSTGNLPSGRAGPFKFISSRRTWGGPGHWKKEPAKFTRSELEVQTSTPYVDWVQHEGQVRGDPRLTSSAAGLGAERRRAEPGVTNGFVTGWGRGVNGLWNNQPESLFEATISSSQEGLLEAACRYLAYNPIPSGKPGRGYLQAFAGPEESLYEATCRHLTAQC